MSMTRIYRLTVEYVDVEDQGNDKDNIDEAIFNRQDKWDWITRDYSTKEPKV